MSNLYELMTDVRSEAERGIKRELSGLGGIVKAPIYNMFMPLNVNVQTENDGCCLNFQSGGYVNLNEGLDRNPDVIIESGLSTLERLITFRNKLEFDRAEQTDEIKIVARTSKGEQALSRIREMFK